MKTSHFHRGGTVASAFFAVIALAFTVPAFSQSNTEGAIEGQVVSSAGLVAGVVVTVENLDTGFSRSRESGEDGGFRFAALPTGRYRVSVARQGFNSEPVEIDVNVGEVTPVSMALLTSGQVVDEVVVTGQALNVSTSVAETSTVVTAADLEKLAISRDVTAVALMAPGAVYGDTIWGSADKTRSHYGLGFGMASFGGASAAENAYYINGMNVTNFRNGLGGSTVPFNFYDQFQVKTGGFGAEFGRSTGGVVNAITKRGGNEWNAGVGIYATPDSLRSQSPNVADPSGNTAYDSVYGFDTRDEGETFVYVGGPLVRDRLFVYANYTARQDESDNYTGGSELQVDNDDDPFWGVKLDWYMTENHILEYTGFTDERETLRATYPWDETTGAVGPLTGNAVIARGGQNSILKYTGHFGDNFTLSLLSGSSEYNLTSGSTGDEACPLIYDSRTGGLTHLGCSVTDIPEAGFDEREVFRVDAEVGIGDRHTLRFGVDSEDNTSVNRNFYSGHLYYRYFPVDPGDPLAGGVVPPGVTQVARERVLEGGGAFDVLSDGIYLEDEWDVSDTVTLRLGVRNERFENLNAAGETFIEITDQIAPRLGLSWDVGGMGTSKIFATLGRYHLPIASNTNIRLSGSEIFTEDWYVLNSVAADGMPSLGAQIGTQTVFSDGSIPDVREVIDQNIEPMYQDELIIGYEREILDGYIAGFSFTYRDLGSTIEDVTIDQAVGLPGEFHYILTNPGNDVHTFYDVDADGDLDELFLSAQQMGFPEAVRKYLAWTFTLEKAVTDQLYLSGSYTWSHSYGNIEGYVRSDNGQDDAGLTTLFDFPGLMEGAYGDLPNDRRHQLKLYANYAINDSWSMNGVFTYMSGRPLNAFGLHPTDPYAVQYGAESFYNQGVLTPRGSRGNGDDIYTIDVGAAYTKNMSNGRILARIDVVNLFDLDAVSETDEIADEESGAPSATFGIPMYFQRPRAVRIGLQYDFGPQ